MIGTEIVNTAHHIHSGLQGFGLTGQGAAPTSQDMQPLSEGGIKSFNEGDVTPSAALAQLDQLANLVRTALDNATSKAPLSLVQI